MGTVAPGIRVLPVRTPTLPPATHTNVYIVGEGELTVVDPASPWPDEQELLASEIELRVARGERLRRIVLTHHHDDHVGGALDLRERFATPAAPVPIVAHRRTAELVGGLVDDLVEHAQLLDCGGRELKVHHTPGHAPGHLALHDAASGAVLVGDLVAGVGTIVIQPEDGDLQDYLDSLEAVRRLEPSILLPGHGDPLAQADAVLSFYVAHRHQRTEQVRASLDRLGAASPEDLVPLVYPELGPADLPVAASQILTHLQWMGRHGLARPERGVDRWELVR